MGSGSYDYVRRSSKAASSYHGKSEREIFKSTKINKDMDPQNIKIREARDSEEHPNSFPIILGLDETGSMGMIPHQLIQHGLPEIIEGFQASGIAHPQVCFVAIGDHYSDRHPLQIGQFESSDELMDKWLEKVYLEGNGGGNDGESYLLAWYFAGLMTVHDSFEKRGVKGVLITIGDEPPHMNLESNAVRHLIGNGDLEDDLSAEYLLGRARETFQVFHIGLGNRGENRWTKLLGDNYKQIHGSVEQIPGEVIKLVRSCYETKESEASTGKPDTPVDATVEESTAPGSSTPPIL